MVVADLRFELAQLREYALDLIATGQHLEREIVRATLSGFQERERSAIPRLGPAFDRSAVGRLDPHHVGFCPEHTPGEERRQLTRVVFDHQRDAAAIVQRPVEHDGAGAPVGAGGRLVNEDLLGKGRIGFAATIPCTKPACGLLVAGAHRAVRDFEPG